MFFISSQIDQYCTISFSDNLGSPLSDTGPDIGDIYSYAILPYNHNTSETSIAYG